MRLSRLIRESLDRRASPLRLGDHLGNACQQRLAAHALGAHHEGSTAVHGASGRVLHGNRLSGDHRLVDGTGVVATTPPTEMRSPGGRAANRLPPEGTSSSMKPVPASNAIARTSSRRWSARVGLLIRGAGFEFRTARLSRPRGTVRPRSHAAIDVALLWCRARNSNDRPTRRDRRFGGEDHAHHSASNVERDGHLRRRRSECHGLRGPPGPVGDERLPPGCHARGPYHFGAFEEEGDGALRKLLVEIKTDAFKSVGAAPRPRSVSPRALSPTRSTRCRACPMIYQF
jgi:hypothetical protein